MQVLWNIFSISSCFITAHKLLKISAAGALLFCWLIRSGSWDIEASKSICGELTLTSPPDSSDTNWIHEMIQLIANRYIRFTLFISLVCVCCCCCCCCCWRFNFLSHIYGEKLFHGSSPPLYIRFVRYTVDIFLKIVWRKNLKCGRGFFLQKKFFFESEHFFREKRVSNFHWFSHSFILPQDRFEKSLRIG